MAESVATGVFVDSGFENGVFTARCIRDLSTCQRFVFPAVFLRKGPLPFEFLAA